MKRFFRFSRYQGVLAFCCLSAILSTCKDSKYTPVAKYYDPEPFFTHPPVQAKPGVLWMWMGSNISREGIRADLEALKEAGFGKATIFSLSDITNPWSMVIQKSPTPQIITGSPAWWQLVQFAASECWRLGIELGMFNSPGYETSGGPWITPIKLCRNFAGAKPGLPVIVRNN